jgi:4-azaleucine resistance transporter AzlC
MQPRRLSEFAAGARDTVPMIVGAAPFGVIFGTLVGGSALSSWQGQLLSLAVFAGASQFIALGLFAAHAGFAVIVATTLIVNVRHVLYGATLAPYVAHLPLRWRCVLGFLLTDEVFSVSYRHYRRRPPGETGPWHCFGSGIALYVSWQLSSAAGLVFGATFPRLQALGLDFAMVATFIALVVPQLVALRFVAAAALAGVLSLMWNDWPYKLGLLCAVLAGVALGVLMSGIANGRRDPRVVSRRERNRCNPEASR